MYCTSCGSKLSKGTRFCINCGAKAPAVDDELAEPYADSLNLTIDENDAKDGDGPADAELLESVGFSQAVEPEDMTKKSIADRLIEFRRGTLKAVPTFVLAVVAILAAAGTAYAAYRIVKDVVIPAIQSVQMADEADEVIYDTKADDEESADRDIDAGLLDISKLMSGNSADTLKRLQDLGLTYAADDTLSPEERKDYATEDSPVIWSIPSEGFHGFDALIDAGLYQEPVDLLRKPRVKVYSTEEVADFLYGEPYGTWGTAGCSVADLREGTEISAVEFYNLPTASMDSDGLDKFAQLIGMDGADAYYSSMKEELGDSYQVITGELSVSGKSYLAIFYQWRSAEIPDTEYNSVGNAGNLIITNASTGEDLVGLSELYTAEEYQAAEADVRMEMIAQAMAQRLSEGQNGLRVNFRTGEIQDIFWDGNPGTPDWISLEQSEQEHGYAPNVDYLDPSEYVITDLSKADKQ